MRPGGTVECQRKIESFLNQGPEMLARLKELLPIIFDSHRVFTKEEQMRLLSRCSLAPILIGTPFHQVTFALRPEEGPSTSSQGPSSVRQSTRSASGTSEPS